MEKTKDKKKSRSTRYRIIGVIFSILLALVAGFLVYPSFTDSLSDINNTMVIGGYTGSVTDLTEDEIFSLKQAAQAYNELIWDDQQYRPFRYTGEEYSDSLYDSILKTSSLNSVMAYIEIPFINAYVPIVHGTSSNDLLYQAGHMYGTSVPIGGENTKSVIAAHSGLMSVDLFTGLDKITEGEEIYIHVLDEIHVYEVVKTNTVLPEKINEYLQIEEGKDMIALYTCTPYGINSHRFIATCVRTGDRAPDSQQGNQATLRKNSILSLVHTVLWALIPFLVLLIGLLLVLTKRGRKILNRIFGKKKKPAPEVKPANTATEEEELILDDETLSTDDDTPARRIT